MKKLTCILIALLLCAALSVTAFASSYVYGVSLTDAQQQNVDMLVGEIERTFGITPYFLFNYELEQGALDEYTDSFLDSVDETDIAVFAISEVSFLLYVSDSAEAKTGLTHDDQETLYDAIRDADEQGDYSAMTLQYYSALMQLLAERRAGGFGADDNGESGTRTYTSSDFDGKRMRDEADLLTSSEEETLEALLGDISARQQMDVIVRTVSTFPGLNADDYAEAWYDASDYGVGADKSGCMLFISMEDRDWCITSTGRAESSLNAYAREQIGDQIVPSLSDGDYAKAFTKFANLVDDFATEAETNEPYSDAHPYKAPYEAGKHIVIGLIVGVIISLVTVAGIKNQYKPVRHKVGASDYMVNGSFVLQSQYDNFLYNNVTRTRRSSDSSSGGGGGSHTSSSGRSTSGKF